MPLIFDQPNVGNHMHHDHLRPAKSEPHGKRPARWSTTASLGTQEQMSSLSGTFSEPGPKRGMNRGQNVKFHSPPMSLPTGSQSSNSKPTAHLCQVSELYINGLAGECKPQTPPFGGKGNAMHRTRRRALNMCNLVLLCKAPSKIKSWISSMKKMQGLAS